MHTPTSGILDKDFVNVIHFVEAGSPALLGLLRTLAAAGVPPHELVVVQGAIRRALGIAPPAHTADAITSMEQPHQWMETRIVSG